MGVVGAGRASVWVVYNGWKSWELLGGMGVILGGGGVGVCLGRFACFWELVGLPWGQTGQASWGESTEFPSVVGFSTCRTAMGVLEKA
jgi:hypothetical protein